MTEEELLGLAIGGTDAVVQIVATAFAIISAYIAGLHFFLGRSGLGLKAASFLLLSVALAFLGVMAMGLYGILGGTDAAWRALPEVASGVTSLGGERPPYLMGFSVYEVGAGLGFGAFALVYVALAYLTFVHRW